MTGPLALTRLLRIPQARPTPRPRERQRERAYRAEKEVWTYEVRKGREYVTAGGRIEEVADIQRWLDQLAKRAWWRRRWPSRRLEVRSGRGSHAGYNRITLAPWGRCRLIVLHEAAHCLTPRCEGHGWEWAATYLLLVRLALGKELHDQLKAAFKRHRVRFHRPRARRPLSPEQRAVLVERLARWRMNRAS